MAKPVELSARHRPLESDPGAAACELAAIAALLDAGETEAAAPRIAALLGADPADAEAWFLQARVLAVRGQSPEAQEACRRAIELWPDIMPVYRLLSDLAADAPGDANPNLDTARRMLLAQDPDELLLANRIAADLCAAGRFEAALMFLRQAAPVLGHRDSALWNYTTSLAVTGRTHELLSIEPMLAGYAREVAPPFGPFAHLAGAKLAQQADRDAVLREISTVQESPRWLDAAGLAERLAGAIAARRPYSVVLLSEAHARLVSYASLRAHLVLSEPEMSAVVNSVWRDASGTCIEEQGAPQTALLARRLLSAIAQADVIALPEAAHLAAAHEHFGFLAETQRIALQGERAYASLGVFAALHTAMPYLRPLLANQPFLGFVGFYPDLAERLGRFAQIAETVTYAAPAALNRGDLPEALRGPIDPASVLDALAVPYPGAVFLVGAGILGTLFCGRIRELGGIAIDVDLLVTRWMPA